MRTIVLFLNIGGLVIGLVAAILMARYPPRVLQITEKGEAPIAFVANPTEEGKRRGTRQQRLSEAAPWLLAVAFGLQLIALLLSSY
jgi:hypothetical protein